MKQISDKLKEFIIENSDLINYNEFEKLYNNLFEAIRSGYFYDYDVVPQLTQVLLASGIEFLPYMKKIPMGCYEHLDIKEVDIPSNIREIDIRAFSGCESLSTVNISEGVEMLRTGAFKDCLSLKTITLPDSMTKVNLAAFVQSGLEELKLPHTLESINTTLAGCDKLKSIYLPKCKYIDEDLVRYCRRLENIYFEGTEIDWLHAFDGKLRDSVKIHFNVKY